MPFNVRRGIIKLFVKKLQPLALEDVSTLLTYHFADQKDPELLEVVQLLKPKVENAGSVTTQEIDELFAASLREPLYSLFGLALDTEFFDTKLTSTQVEVNEVVFDLARFASQREQPCEEAALGMVPYRGTQFRVFVKFDADGFYLTSNGILKVRISPTCPWSKRRVSDPRESRDLPPNPKVSQPSQEHLVPAVAVVHPPAPATVAAAIPPVPAAMAQPPAKPLHDSEWILYINDTKVDISELTIKQSVLRDVPAFMVVEQPDEHFFRPVRRAVRMPNGSTVVVRITRTQDDKGPGFVIESPAVLNVKGPRCSGLAFYSGLVLCGPGSDVNVSSGYPGMPRALGHNTSFRQMNFTRAPFASTEVCINGEVCDLKRWEGQACPWKWNIDMKHGGMVELKMETDGKSGCWLSCRALASGFSLNQSYSGLCVQARHNFFLPQIRCVGLRDGETVVANRVFDQKEDVSQKSGSVEVRFVSVFAPHAPPPKPQVSLNKMEVDWDALGLSQTPAGRQLAAEAAAGKPVQLQLHIKSLPALVTLEEGKVKRTHVLRINEAYVDLECWKESQRAQEEAEIKINLGVVRLTLDRDAQAQRRLTVRLVNVTRELAQGERPMLRVRASPFFFALHLCAFGLTEEDAGSVEVGPESAFEGLTCSNSSGDVTVTLSSKWCL